MKKIFSVLLIAALVLGLGITAYADNDLTDEVINITEDDFANDTVSGNLEGSGDFALRTRYGFLWIRDDGSFTYRVDQELPAVQKAVDSKQALVDHFILTFRFTDSSGWKGRYMNIAIVPDGAKAPGYENYAITDLGEALEGTILYGRETAEEMALRVPLGRLDLDNDGHYVYTNYNFLEGVQALLPGRTREDRLPAAIVNADGTAAKEFSFVVRTTGTEDKPVVQNYTYTLKVMDYFDTNLNISAAAVNGNVLYGAKLGDGYVGCHSFKWDPIDPAAHAGSIAVNADGSFYYKIYEPLDHEPFSFIETYTYSYTDADGDVARGTLTIVLDNLMAPAG